MKFQFLLATIAIIFQIQSTDAIKRARTIVPSIPIPPGTMIPSNQVAEAGCGVRKAASDLKTEFINKAPAWYVPVAHKHFYYSWAEALINRSIVPSVEMHTMCMKWLFLSPTKPKGKYNVVVGGLKNAVTQLCMDTGFETETCEAPLNSPTHHKNADNVGTIIATDNVRWFLLYRCVQNKNRDWAVFVSDSKPLDPELYKKLAITVREHGFDLKNVENGKLDKCPRNSN